MKILIVDDHDLVCQTIAAFLRAEGDIEVATAKDVSDACTAIAAERPFDLVLLDYTMPGMNGLAGLDRVLDAVDGAPVALMSGTATAAVAREGVARGAAGFLPKTLSATSLVNAIRFIAAGETYLPANLPAEITEGEEHPLAAKLSRRERQVLEGLSRGLANKEIARELDLQEVTIKLHVKTLCSKLSAKNRTHAAMIAKEAGIV